MRRQILRVAVAASLSAWAMAAPAAADPAPASLHAKPVDAGTTLPAGISRIAKGGFAYRPPNAGPGPLPLLVLLHGAQGDAKHMLESFRPVADRHGCLLLALQSAGSTWELRPQPAGRDVSNLDAVLAELFAKAAVDPKRLAVLGFSDGASYALSIGLANPQLFRGIVALSPGFAWRPPHIDPEQRLFISHGKRDPVLPFANVRDKIVPGLRSAGSDPHVRWFNGVHEIDRAALEEGIAFALAGED